MMLVLDIELFIYFSCRGQVHFAFQNFVKFGRDDAITPETLSMPIRPEKVQMYKDHVRS